MTLLNVRLGPEDARMAAALRKNGVQISRVVRDALRAAYQRQAAAHAQRGRPSDVMASIYREVPDASGQPRERRDLGDRHAIRRVIRKRLRRPRS
jgi:hypothetical protein